MIICLFLVLFLIRFGTRLSRRFKVIFLDHTSFGELCSYAMRQVFSPQLLSLWRAMFINILWYIWSSRNRYLFENIRPSIWKITASLWADIQETNKLPIGHMFNSQEDLLCLHALHIIGHPKKAPRILEVHWNLPPPGWIKCNSDGSALGAPGMSTCGGVFRNSRGFVKGCF